MQELSLSLSKTFPPPSYFSVFFIFFASLASGDLQRCYDRVGAGCLHLGWRFVAAVMEALPLPPFPSPLLRSASFGAAIRWFHGWVDQFPLLNGQGWAGTVVRFQRFLFVPLALFLPPVCIVGCIRSWGLTASGGLRHFWVLWWVHWWQLLAFRWLWSGGGKAMVSILLLGFGLLDLSLIVFIWFAHLMYWASLYVLFVPG